MTEREHVVAWLEQHYGSRCPSHNPDAQRGDLVTHGYGNACVNIIAAVARGDHLASSEPKEWR